jgi:hypothetical protein
MKVIVSTTNPDKVETLHDFTDCGDYWSRYICPFCNRLSERRKEEDCIECDDYVTHPMIWCWYGDTDCEARSILLEKTMKEVPYDELLAEFPTCSDKIIEIKEDDPTSRFFTFELAKITKIVTWAMQSLHSSVLLEEEVVRELIDISDEDKAAFMEKHSIIERPKDMDDEFELWNISLPVDSYDSENPLKEYPDKLDLDHGGIHIYLICEDMDGKEFESCYWGD